MDRENNHTDKTYRIRLKGKADQRWMNWFDDFDLIPHSNDETQLVGPISDQSALHGLLARIRNLGLPLISIETISPKEH